MTLSPGVYDPAHVDQLLTHVEAVVREVGRQRAGLHRSWRTQTKLIERVQDQLRAVDFTLERRQSAYRQLLRETGATQPLTASAAVPTNPDRWLVDDQNGTWAVHPPIEKHFDQDLTTARDAFRRSREKFFGGGSWREGETALGRFALRLSQLQQVRTQLEKDLDTARLRRTSDAAEQRAASEAALAAAVAFADVALAQLPASTQPWENAIWQSWTDLPPLPPRNGHVVRGAPDSPQRSATGRQRRLRNRGPNSVPHLTGP